MGLTDFVTFIVQKIPPKIYKITTNRKVWMDHFLREQKITCYSFIIIIIIIITIIYLCCCCCCYYGYFFIYIFIYLQRHACSVVKYLDGEFTKIVNVLWLLAILFYIWNFSFYLIYHLFSYYFIYFFHLLFYLLISAYMSRVYILAASRYYWHVLVCFTIFD